MKGGLKMGLFDDVIGDVPGIRTLFDYGDVEFKGSIEIIGDLLRLDNVSRESLVDTGLTYINNEGIRVIARLNEIKSVKVDIVFEYGNVFLMSVTGKVGDNVVLFDSILLDWFVDVRESEIIITTNSIRVVLDTRELKVDDIVSKKISFETQENDGRLEKALSELGQEIYECSFRNRKGFEVRIVIDGFLNHRKIGDTLYLDADGRYKDDMNSIHISEKVKYEEGIRVTLTNKHIEYIGFDLGEMHVGIERVRD